MAAAAGTTPSTPIATIELRSATPRRRLVECLDSTVSGSTADPRTDSIAALPQASFGSDAIARATHRHWTRRANDVTEVKGCRGGAIGTHQTPWNLGVGS